jgi:hypothetical protein
MPSRSRQRRPEPHDIAAEIIRRASLLNDPYSGSHVIVLSDPPTAQERLQLIAADLQGTPMMVTTPSMTEDEWEKRYCRDHDAPAECL